MEAEILQTYSGRLSKKGVVLLGLDPGGELDKKGYGERREEELVLADFEALFLLYSGRLKLVRGRKEVSLNDFVEYALKRDKAAWTRFLIYRDLRTRGYVAKDGFGFGVDFRTYDRGEYGSKPARYVVFGVNEGTEMPTDELKETVAQITRMGKMPIIAVVERRGEVIYYRVSKARLTGPPATK